MKILFVAPPLPIANSYAQPLGFAYMGSILRNEGFTNIRILDACSLDLSIKDTIQLACEFEPDVVGITVMTVTVNNGLKIACGLKALLPKVKIVFGGVHASVLPEDLLNNTFVDIVVRNEGEYTFLEVVQRLVSGEDLEDIKGTTLNINGEIINNPNRSRIIDLDSLPFPSRDLLPLNEYKERAQKAAAILRREELDALIVNGNEADYANTRYFSGFWPLFERCGVAVGANGDGGEGNLPIGNRPEDC